MAEKKYRSATGVDEFYYGVVDEGTTAEKVERVKFLQTISVEMEQEIVSAYGDNKKAEMGVSSGDISVTAGFHTIPLEDKQTLLGLDVGMELPQWVQVTMHHMLGLFSLKLMKMALNNMLGYLKGCSHVHLSKLTQKRIPLNFQVKKWKHNLWIEK